MKNFNEIISQYGEIMREYGSVQYAEWAMHIVRGEDNERFYLRFVEERNSSIIRILNKIKYLREHCPRQKQIFQSQLKEIESDCKGHVSQNFLEAHLGR